MGVFEMFSGVFDSHEVAEKAPTGVSVFLFPDGAAAAAEVRGFAAGTRQFDSLSISHTVDRIHGLVFAGGSVFGHGAAQEVVHVLASKGIGIATEHGCVPVVPSAVIYDLGLGGGASVDYGELGRRAAEKALSGRGEVTFGAGAGASVGKLLGLERATKTASGYAVCEGDHGYLGVFVVLNSFGEVTDGTGRIIAGIRGDGTFVPTRDLFMEGVSRKPFAGGENTTLALIVAEAELSALELHYLCSQGNNFLASMIRPYGTVYDGDVVVSVSTGKRTRSQSINKIVSAVEGLLEEAVLKAVKLARGAAGVPSAGEFTG